MSLATRMRQPDGTSVCHISPTLTAIIESNGFRINPAKVRLSQRQHRQEVTSLIVNKRINVKRRFIREVRAMLHAWQKFGLAAAQSEFTKIHNGNTANFESVVRGKIGFIGYVRGRPDILFRNFATQFNKLTTGPKIRTELTKEEIALQAVWVVEHEEGQGTAFFVEGYGLITCAHCVGPKLYVYNPSDHTKKYPVTVIAQEVHIDLAILTIPPALSGVIPIPLNKGPAPIKGAAVQLLGYPAHHAARPIRVESGTIIRTFPKSAVTYLEITPKIIGGNSGGPVVNDKFEAVGVAVLGLNGKIDLKSTEFLAVSVNELKGLSKVKVKK
jgi:RNA-directed DNA polymerase